MISKAETEQVNSLISWYIKLKPRYVDVTESGGKEFFVIDGDSLLAHFAFNPKTFLLQLADNSPDYATLHPKPFTWCPLHLIWLVERFIIDLYSRGAKFDIVFFACNKIIWGNDPSYLIFRSCAIRHLQGYANTESCQFNVWVMESWKSEDWSDLFCRRQPRFILISDGSTEDVAIGPATEYDESCNVETDFMLRTHVWRMLMHDILRRKAMVTLLPNLGFKGGRVVAFMIDRGVNLAAEYSFLKEYLPDPARDRDSEELIWKLHTLQPQSITESQTILALTLAQLPFLDSGFKKLLCFFIATIPDLPLELRAQNCARDLGNSFTHTVSTFLKKANQVLEYCAKSTSYNNLCSAHFIKYDLCNFFDEKMFGVFIAVLGSLQKFQFPHQTWEKADTIWSIVCSLSDTLEDRSLSRGVCVSYEIMQQDLFSIGCTDLKLHKFHQNFFTEILQDIGNPGEYIELDNFEEFGHQEIYHWHSLELLDKKATSSLIAPEKALRYKQNYIKFMHRYAQSFGGVKGLYFSNIIGPQNRKKLVNTAKTEKKSASAQRIIQENLERKAVKGGVKAQSRFEQLRKELHDIKSFQAKKKAIELVLSFDNQSAEITIKTNLLLIQIMIQELYMQRKLQISDFWSLEIVELIAKIYSLVKGIFQDFPTNSKTEALNEILCKIMAKLGFTECKKQISSIYEKKSSRGPSRTIQQRKDSVVDYSFIFPHDDVDISIGMQDYEFQMKFCGHLFDRSTGAAKDSRVPFEPDDWQRKLLDIMDARESALVCAPTSSGKTFIAFYAMEQILISSDTDIVIYISPTKALCNQTAAEVYARFGMKAYPKGGKSIFGIYTRDYQYEPMNCQILTCVPEILEILLLSPVHNKDWIHHIKCIIFDEIHMIGEMDSGSVWERLLLLAPCNILALSATISNAIDFHMWISNIQQKKGIKMHLVTSERRYSDLKKYVYIPSSELNDLFKTRPAQNSLYHINPVATLSSASFMKNSFPPDLKLLPEECLDLHVLMTKNKQYPKNVLDPKCYFKGKGFLRKDDSDSYEAKIKAEIHKSAESSDISEVFSTISACSFKKIDQMEDSEEFGSSEWMLKEFPNLIAELSAQNKLPALVFCLDRVKCYRLAMELTEVLENLEEKKRQNDKTYQAKKEQSRKQEEINRKLMKKAKKTESKIKNKDEEKEELALPVVFDWKKDDPEYTLIEEKYRFTTDELEDIGLNRLRKTLPEGYQPLLEALNRGIAIHHGGMPRKYLEVVEVMFRKKYVQVVIATGTLALGISAPCKTVVFAGNSVFLNGNNYRQMSGRAGRRGFDLKGHVVFFGIPNVKIRNLMGSSLIPLSGHFPISTSLVLRILCLATQLPESSKNTKQLCDKPAAYVTNVVRDLFTNSFFEKGNEIHNEQIIHHLKFSIEYLLREKLIRSDGSLIGFSGIVSHLYYLEPANFLFASILRSGILRKICSDFQQDSKGTVLKLLVVLANIFNRVPLRNISKKYYQKVIHSSTSVVFLEPFPPKIAQFVRNYNNRVLSVYTSYAMQYSAHAEKNGILPPDTVLPLSQINFNIEIDNENGLHFQLKKTSRKVTTRSKFSALSGHDDEFVSAFDLSSNLRAKFNVDKDSIPLVEDPDPNKPWNAYIVDFFKHGQMRTIEKVNGIKEGQSFQKLKDVMLILRAICSSMTLLANDDDSDILCAFQALSDEYQNTFMGSIAKAKY